MRSSVEDSLASAIISGEFGPGTLLTVPTLAAKFAVSATPVREAMLNLEKRGFVESVKNKGFRVTEVSDNDLREIVQLRGWLEVPAMLSVAERLSAGSLQQLRVLADRITTAARNDRFQDYLDADVEFHLALLRTTGNQRLVDMVSELRKQTRMVGLMSLSHTKELDASAGEHNALLDLLADGKGHEAGALLARHIGHVLGWWAGMPEEADDVPVL